MFVYVITNTINGKRYIGQTTTSLERRWWFHQKHSSCTYIHAAIKKYGPKNFTIEVICEPPTIELMDEFEAEYIKRYCTLAPNGYNLTEGGRVPRHTEITRKKMSLSHMGMRHSEESIRKSADGLRGIKRRHEQTTRKLSLEQASEIRQLYFTGDYTQTTLAKRFGINQQQISKMVRNLTYRN